MRVRMREGMKWVRVEMRMRTKTRVNMEAGRTMRTEITMAGTVMS